MIVYCNKVYKQVVANYCIFYYKNFKILYMTGQYKSSLLTYKYDVSSLFSYSEIAKRRGVFQHLITLQFHSNDLQFVVTEHKW
jgi:hypothetical protein